MRLFQLQSQQQGSQQQGSQQQGSQQLCESLEQLHSKS